MSLSREELLRRLRDEVSADPESGHLEADRALLEFIDDPEVTEAFEAIAKWYA